MSSKKRTEGFQDGSICYQILYGTWYQTHHYFQRMVLYTPLGPPPPTTAPNPRPRIYRHAAVALDATLSRCHSIWADESPKPSPNATDGDTTSTAVLTVTNRLAILKLLRKSIY